MNGGGRRQLPSWMMRPNAAEQAIISETKGENIEDGSVEPHTKAVKPQKKVRTNKDDPAVPLAENKLPGPKTRETRTRKRKSDDLDKGQGETFQEDEPSLLKPCKRNRRKRMSVKRNEDLVDDDSFDSDVEKKVDGALKKRVQDNAPRKRHSKKLEEVHNVTAESCPSEDELTVEDLISIAEEYVKADRDKEFQKSKNVEIEPETKHLLRADSGNGSEKDLTFHVGDRLVNDLPPSDSSLTKPSSSEGSINKLSTTDDPARDILEMFLGPWLKKSREPERKIDAITEEKTIDFQLNKRSQNDAMAEVAPVMKKKYSLKDKVGRLLE